MPYLNDLLNDNKELNARNRLEAQVTRASRFTFNPGEVIKALQKRIIGQDEVIAAMSDMLYVLKADFSEPNRPLSINLFLGPTGVGKTETVRVLTKSILGDEGALCRIDMNTLAQEHYAAALTGAPPGYVGSKEGHTLFNIEAIEGSFSRPGIVLFDEIEKASKEVIRSLLNILDTGKLEMAGGTKTVNFCNSIIFMTSNLGARELAAYSKRSKQSHPLHGFAKNFLTSKRDSKDVAWKIVETAIKNTFDPEFINRIERQILFNPLEEDFVNDIVNLEIQKLNTRLKRKGAEITLSPTARSQIASYYNQEYGARNIIQHIRLKIYPAIAKSMVQKEEQQHFEVDYGRAGFTVK